MVTVNTTHTTRLLVTRTTRLRATIRAFDPYTVGSIAILLLIVVVGTLWRGLVPAAQPAPIIIFATAPRPAIEHQASRAPFAVRAVPTLAPTTAPELAPIPVSVPAVPEQQLTVSNAPAQPTEAGYIANTTNGPLFVPDSATPVPAGASYDGPFLAPAATEQPATERYCTGFGDWRDYDAAYAASPACHEQK